MRLRPEGVRTWFALLVAFPMLLVHGEVRADADLSERITRLDESISATPSSPAVAALFLARAELHRTHLEWKKSLDDLDAATRLNPNLEGLELQRGLTLASAGRTHEAVVAFKDHLSSRPDDGFAWIHLGRALAELQVYADASEAFTRSIELSTRPGPGLFLERADAIQARGSAYDSDALNSIESGISTIGPAISLELRALSLETQLGRFDQALRRVSFLTERAHSKAPWLLRRAEILLLAKRPDEARRTIKEAKAFAANVPISRRHTPSHVELVRSIEDLLEAEPE